MAGKRKILILGASYGSLFGTKLLMAGHAVTLVCTPGTAELINREGTIVRFPIQRPRRRCSMSPPRNCRENSPPARPDDVQPEGFDLVVLGMQESQYGTKGVRELMGAHRQGARAVPGDHEHAAADLSSEDSGADDRCPGGLLYRSFGMGRL